MNPYRTPRSGKRRASRSRSRGRKMRRTTSSRRTGARRRQGGVAPSVGESSVNALLDVASNPTPIGLARAGSTLYSGYRARQQTNKFTNKAYLSGKYGGFVKLGKKAKTNQNKIAKIGITNNYESRKTVTGEEAVVIGHTSMPGKVTSHNMWRAILKMLFLEMKCYIKDYGALMIGSGFIANDAVSVNYYPTGVSNSTTSVDKTISNLTTFDGFATEFCIAFDAIAAGNPEGIRLDSIEFHPSVQAGIMLYGKANLNLVGAKISCYTKSVLKVQNVTVEVSTDNESDDVNAVPLHGKVFGCRGNNFVKKANNALLSGTFQQYNEDSLFAGYTREIGNVFGGTTFTFYAASEGPTNNNQTTFHKPAEPPKHWEIQNCQSEGKLHIAPGEIKTSTLTRTFEMSLQYMFNLLYNSKNTNNNKLVYNEDQGSTNVMYLEKTIGKLATPSNKITLWVELDFRQSIMCSIKKDKFTLPIQYQTDF